VVLDQVVKFQLPARDQVVKFQLPASGPGPGGEGGPLAGDAKGGNTAGGHSTSLQAILQYLP
jgi:hypothetical protein